jgi:hypothetical protein
MKVTFKIMIIISLLLIILVGFQLVDSYISMNYDPDVYANPNNWERNYSVNAMSTKIMWLWIFFGYLLTNIFICFKAIKKKHTFSAK